MRLCTEWVIYADDCTVRTGRCLDGQLYTDAEISRRTAEAAETEQTRAQELSEAFRACGFNPESLGAEKKRAKTTGEKKTECKGKSKGSPSPFAHLLMNIMMIMSNFLLVTIPNTIAWGRH